MTYDFEKINNLKPTSLEDFIDKAFSLRLDGYYEESIKYVKTHMSSYVGNYRIYELLADNYLMLGNFKQCNKYASVSLSLNPDSTTGQYLKAASLMGLQNFKKAVYFWEKVVESNNKEPEFLMKLGQCKFFISKSEEEIDKSFILMKRAFLISGEDPDIAESLGLALATEGRYSEAEEYFAKSNLNEEQLAIIRSFKKLVQEN